MTNHVTHSHDANRSLQSAEALREKVVANIRRVFIDDGMVTCRDIVDEFVGIVQSEVDAAILAERTRCAPCEGYVRLASGEDVPYIGTLPRTKDNVIVGHNADVWWTVGSGPSRWRTHLTGICRNDDYTKTFADGCYSTEAAARLEMGS